MNYDAIIEQLGSWALVLESAVNRHPDLEAQLNSVISGMRDVATDLARDSDLPAEFRTFGPGDPKRRSDALNTIIARLRARDTFSPTEDR